MASSRRADAERLSHHRAPLPHETRRDRPDRPARKSGADRRGQGAEIADRGDGGDRPTSRSGGSRARPICGWCASAIMAGCRCASTWWRCCRGAGLCMSRMCSTGATELWLAFSRFDHATYLRCHGRRRAETHEVLELANIARSGRLNGGMPRQAALLPGARGRSRRAALASCSSRRLKPPLRSLSC